MIKYYEEFHAKHPNVIVLFRDGNKYYTYKETAKIVKQLCNEHTKFDGSVATIKSSDISSCISTLIRNGEKVGLCDKM